MSNLGAIPKSFNSKGGGARPKTRVLANGLNPEANLGSENARNCTLERTVTNTSRTENDSRKAGLLKSPNTSSNEHEVTSEVPLEAKEIVTNNGGVQERKPALSPAWVVNRTFMHYMRPPQETLDSSFLEGATDAWLEQMQFLVDDLTWLLGSPHHRFWSQVVYDSKVQECLESYLSNGPRWYDSLTSATGSNPTFLPVISEVHQLVFLVYLRLSTYKESKDAFISPSTFGMLIYDNYLYDICKCLDLCALYGTSNRQLLEKMMHNIFTHQPKYFSDLGALVDTLKNVLETLEQKLNIHDPSIPRSVCPEDTCLAVDELEDIVRYSLDTFCSLQAFLSVFPAACDTFYFKEFFFRLAIFYERAIPKLMEMLYPSDGDDDDDRLLKLKLQKDVRTVRFSCLFIFREIVAWVCLPKQASDGRPCSMETISRGIESFTQTFTSCLEEKLFITDYNATFGVDQDLNVFQEKGADMTPLNFVREAVNSIVSEMTLPAEELSDEELVATEAKTVEEPLTNKSEDPSGMNGYYAGETRTLSVVEMESLTSSIKDLLPDFGNGFIRQCLKYYNYSSEDTLNALLEGNLPPALDTLDRSLKEFKEDTPPAKNNSEPESKESLKKEEDPLCNRLNVYDDDEFDVFSQTRNAKVDKSRIHKGKAKLNSASNRGLERDPELAEKMKRILHEYESTAGYSIYEDEEKYTPIHASAEYDDEYDDTYDDDETGDVDGRFLDDDKRRRVGGSFVSMRGRGALNTPGLKFGEEEEEEEAEEDPRKEDEKEEMRKRQEEQMRGKKQHNNNRFKRANASDRRGPLLDENPEQVPSLVFNNSRRGGRPPRIEEEPPVEPDSRGPYDGGPQGKYARHKFVPFCENPEEIRRRHENRRMANQFRNKGYNYQSNKEREEPDSSQQGPHGYQGPPYQDPSSYQGPRTSTKSSKHSGKSWRQGTQGEEDGDRRQHGGKYKEDTNHGKPQDRSHRYKMMHKNEQRRNAAQAKYRNNF